MSHLPRPRDLKAFDESVRRHYPREPAAAGTKGAALVDVDIDAQGYVRNARALPSPEPLTGTRYRAVTLKTDPKTGKSVEQVLGPRYDSAFGPPAEAALRETRFFPAVRTGLAVPYTVRMTIEFAPPTASR